MVPLREVFTYRTCENCWVTLHENERWAQPPMMSRALRYATIAKMYLVLGGFTFGTGKESAGSAYKSAKLQEARVRYRLKQAALLALSQKSVVA